MTDNLYKLKGHTHFDGRDDDPYAILKNGNKEQDIAVRILDVLPQAGMFGLETEVESCLYTRDRHDAGEPLDGDKIAVGGRRTHKDIHPSHMGITVTFVEPQNERGWWVREPDELIDLCDISNGPEDAVVFGQIERKEFDRLVRLAEKKNDLKALPYSTRRAPLIITPFVEDEELQNATANDNYAEDIEEAEVA